MIVEYILELPLCWSFKMYWREGMILFARKSRNTVMASCFQLVCKQPFPRLATPSDSLERMYVALA